MPETSHIAEIAEKVSNDLFTVFGWERRPPRDRNWPCVTAAHKLDTHPSDVVFCYEDPVEHSTIFFNTDLKSYKRDSIAITKVKAALKSLALGTECAGKSSGWRDLYVNPVQNYKVNGLLFVYNHDNGFDESFGTYLNDITSRSIKVARWGKVFTIGPKEIQYLLSVANDIKCERGEKTLPDANHCSFFYPELVRVRLKENFCKAATIEMLLGPWQVLCYENGGKSGHERGCHLYYSGEGKTPEEFKYIFDYLFRYGRVRPDEKVSVRLARGVREAKLHFENAKEQYALDFFPHVKIEDTKQRLSTIDFARINTVITQFSDLDLGMDSI